MSNNTVERYWLAAFPYLTALIAFAVYLITMAPGVLQIDSGELAAALYNLGLPHATGYPLFTLVGYVFAHLPLPLEPVAKLNLMAALFTAAACGIIAALGFKLYTQLYRFAGSTSNEPHVQVSPRIASVLAVLTALIAAFTKVFWMQSVGIEVYSLHALCISLALLALLNCYLNSNTRNWLILAFTLGLGFGNHMSTLYVIPAVAYVFFTRNGLGKAAFVMLAKMLVLFFAMLAIFYGFLVIRAGQNPIINWGNPQYWDAFWYHVLGKQFQVWVFSGNGVARKQLGHFFSTLPGYMGWAGLLLALGGLIHLWINYRKAAVIISLFTGFALFMAVNYDIADIDSYFLLVYLGMALMAGAALTGLYTKLKKAVLPFALGLVAVAAQVVTGAEGVSERNTTTFKEYTRAVLNQAGDNGIIISRQWDFMVSPSLYFQYVEGQKPGVVVVDRELLRRTWYYNQLNTQHPEFTKTVAPEIEKMKVYLYPFEHNQTFIPDSLEKYYRALLNNGISRNLQTGKDVYLTLEVATAEIAKGEIVLPQGYTLAPVGLLFKVVPVGSYTANVPVARITYATNTNTYVQAIKEFQFQMLVFRAAYEKNNNRLKEQKESIAAARALMPEMEIPQELL